MARTLHWALQVALYAAFAGAMGYLSILPEYHYASAAVSEVKVSLSHAASRVEPCIQLTPQQIADLAPNMRRTEECARQRLPLTVEIDIDDNTVLQLEALPSGMWNDGPASVYERFSVLPGRHRISARLRDTDRIDGWDYAHTEYVELEAGRYFTVTFRAESGGFLFR